MEKRAVARFTKRKTKLSAMKSGSRVNQSRAPISGMTPRNESIRRSITTEAAFLGTRGRYRPGPSTFLIDAIIIYCLVPCADVPRGRRKNARKEYTRAEIETIAGPEVDMSLRHVTAPASRNRLLRSNAREISRGGGIESQWLYLRHGTMFRR